MWHWLTTTFWGGFVVGVTGNLVASAVLTVPIVVRQAVRTRAQAKAHHEERKRQHAELMEKLENHESHHAHPDGAAVGHRDRL